MILATQFSIGTIFTNENGAIVEVITVQHHRKSQARAVVRVKLRNVETGTIIETAYRPEDKFEEVIVEKRPKTYVYSDAEMAYFMDDETYDQTGFPLSKLENEMKYITDNMAVEGLYLNGKFFGVRLPANIVMEVVETEDVVRGNTSSNVTKDAKVNTGLVIKVPAFIKQGDKVRVDTRSATYVERCNDKEK